MTRDRHTRGAAAAAALAACAAAGSAAQETSAEGGASGIVEAIKAGDLILSFRPRYAHVEQTGFDEDASALTLRTVLGWETAAYNGFTGLLEFEDVRAPVDDYNSTTNGKTSYPVEADPETTEVNRVQLSWTDGAGLAATAGRQRIILDNARFVGNVGWRQDEQTYDSARIDYARGAFAVTYAYLWGVERVFAETQDWDSDSHLVNARFTASEALTLTGFAYALDLEQAPGLSTVTYGASASGVLDIGELEVGYAATLATQSDYGDNPADVDLSYGDVDLAAKHGSFSAGVGYEVLEGDGSRGFSTPLATLHAFQGWADVFLATPATGLTDLSVTGAWSPDWSAGPLSSPALTAVWHDFEAEQGGAGLGSEIDVQLTARLGPKVTGVLKLADYDGPTGGPGPFADRTKVWVGLQLTL